MNAATTTDTFAVDYAAADKLAAHKMLDSIEWRAEGRRKEIDEFLSSASERSIEHAVTWHLQAALGAEKVMNRYGEIDAAIRGWLEDPSTELEALIERLRKRYNDDLLRAPWEGRSSSAGSNLVAQAYASSLVKAMELCDMLVGYVPECRRDAEDAARKAAIEAETAKYAEELGEYDAVVFPTTHLDKHTFGLANEIKTIAEPAEGFAVIRAKYDTGPTYYAVEKVEGGYLVHAHAEPGRKWSACCSELAVLATYRAVERDAA